MKKASLLLLLLCVCVSLRAQTDHVYVDRLDIKKGLPESYIRAMAEDSQGYMWIATQNGLVRYDGYNYKIYYLGSEKTNLTPVTNVLSIVVDHKKTVWVTVIGNGVFRYNRATDSFEQFPYPSKSFFQYLGIRERIIKVVKFDTRTKSYAIVVKGHGGSITINTKEGEFTEFVICLPI